MLPNTELRDVARSTKEAEEKDVVFTPLNERPLEEIAQHGILATEGGNVVNQGGIVVSDEDSNTSSTNIFSDPDVAAHYVAVYDKAHYECRHVFDPDLDWTKKEEKRVIRKLDWHGKIPYRSSRGPSTNFKVVETHFDIIVCAWACVMFFALQTDRGNLAQAIADNLLTDLHLTTNGRIPTMAI
jgi:hypothetical protein